MLTMMLSQNAPKKFPIALRSAVPLIRSACLENLDPSIRLVADRLGRPSSRSIRNLVTEGGPDSRIPYDHEALEYNRTFFLRNAVKCFTVSQILLNDWHEIGNGAVLDVGGGIGTFALSISGHGRWSDQLVVDSSPAQIALGRQLVGLANCGHHMRWLASDRLPSAWSPDPIALFSYSLCESPHLLKSASEKGWRTALVVDYPDTIDRCATYALEIGARFARTRAQIELCPDLAEAIGQTNISANGAMIISG